MQIFLLAAFLCLFLFFSHSIICRSHDKYWWIKIFLYLSLTLLSLSIILMLSENVFNFTFGEKVDFIIGKILFLAIDMLIVALLLFIISVFLDARKKIKAKKKHEENLSKMREKIRQEK